eukprot:scaffold7218_cov52-Attheya_sp.AAC.2
MGQTLTKRVTRVLEKSSLTLERQMKDEAIADTSARKALGEQTGKDPITGFQRGNYGDNSNGSLNPSQSFGAYKEQQQEQFLQNLQKQSGNKNETTEMPEDLIQFLKDTGPLERTVDVARTSGRVLESMKQQQDVISSSSVTPKQPTVRKRREMPMAETLNDEPQREGMTTMRTTNFSQDLEREDIDPAELKLTDGDMYDFLQSMDKETNHNHNKSSESSSSSLSSLVTEYMDTRLFPPSSDTTPDTVVVVLTEEERAENVALLHNLAHYTGVPVLLQDTDNSYVGSWRDRVPTLQMMKLKVVRPEHVHFTYKEKTTHNNNESSSSDDDSGDNTNNNSPLSSISSPPLSTKNPPSSSSNNTTNDKKTTEKIKNATGTAVFLKHESRKTTSKPPS